MGVLPSGEVSKDIRRILGVTLRLVEEGLDDLLAQRDREGILYRVHNDLPGTSWQKVRMLAEKALYLVDDMATRYQLQQEVTKVSQLLHARSPLLWAMVEETKQRDFSGYGLSPGDVLDDLRAKLQELSALLIEMQEVAVEVRNREKETPTHGVGS
jgi:hypothetical protein